MQTQILKALRQTSDGQVAEAILRKCVHCGFCNATCPTYQLLGDENEGPRGRIYLIKQLMEGHLENDAASGKKTLQHLDRCLLCRNCETTCPSGVEYGKLLDIGRHLAEQHAGRERADSAMRHRLLRYLPKAGTFGLGVKLGRAFKPLLPEKLARKVPAAPQPAGKWPAPHHARKMLVLDGCVQPSLAPDINAATARVLDKLGISLIKTPGAGCCGAVSQHLGAPEAAKQAMKRNIDAWWPYLSTGVEAIITTASGCGATVKDYKHYLRDEPEYSIKAERISNLCKDIAEVISPADYQKLAPAKGARIAWHPPCSLQHGQKIQGVVENILTDCGFVLVPVADAHLCCGSAGTYSILQPEIAQQLRSNKLANLTRHQPEMIVTANIGCQTHLQESSDLPVIHWINLLDRVN
jgi:glycolate oxidase iron-sulfur subunit